jgi:hypothetical protein
VAPSSILSRSHPQTKNIGGSAIARSADMTHRQLEDRAARAAELGSALRSPTSTTIARGDGGKGPRRMPYRASTRRLARRAALDHRIGGYATWLCEWHLPSPRGCRVPRMPAPVMWRSPPHNPSTKAGCTRLSPGRVTHPMSARHG